MFESPGSRPAEIKRNGCKAALDHGLGIGAGHLFFNGRPSARDHHRGKRRAVVAFRQVERYCCRSPHRNILEIESKETLVEIKRTAWQYRGIGR